ARPRRQSAEVMGPALIPALARDRRRRKTSRHRLTTRERMRQRAAVDILQLAAYGHTMCDAAGTDAAFRGELTQKMRRRLAFHCWVCCEDQLPHDAFVEDGLELADAKLFRTDTIQR